MRMIEWVSISLFFLAALIGFVYFVLGALRWLGVTQARAENGRRSTRPLLFSLAMAVSFILGALFSLLFDSGGLKYSRKPMPLPGPPPITTQAPQPEENQDDSPVKSSKKYVEVEVFYATDRAATGLKEPSKHYGANRFKGLNWGTCKVSIPRDHRMGNLEAPRWYAFEFSSDPSEHVVLLKVTPLDVTKLKGLLVRRVAGARRKEVLVFIHGFNVTFEDAARRTAQLAYDLGQEVPIFYSWPSKGEEASYAADEASVEWTIPHLSEFLGQLTQVTGSQRINVIAHSMGNRATIRALLKFSQRNPKAKFRNLILTAPDIDADTFQDLAQEFSMLAGRSTLYASASDKAIAISRGVHQAPRAGDAGRHLLVVDGVDTIDATLASTDFLAHSYYGDSRTVISDMFYLIRYGIPPSERYGLREKWRRDRKYWLFVP